MALHDRDGEDTVRTDANCSDGRLPDGPSAAATLKDRVGRPRGAPRDRLTECPRRVGQPNPNRALRRDAAASPPRSSPMKRRAATSGTCAGSSSTSRRSAWVAKESAKTMAKTSVNDLTRKRAARYLKATRGYESTLVPRPDADGLLDIAVVAIGVQVTIVGRRARRDGQRVLAQTRLCGAIVGRSRMVPYWVWRERRNVRHIRSQRVERAGADDSRECLKLSHCGC